MNTKQTYPAIFLPGPVVSPHTVTVSSSTQDWSGKDIRKEISFQGDGSGVVQVLEALQDDYSAWHPYLGCEILIDYGKGSSRGRILDEQFGQFFFTVEEIR